MMIGMLLSSFALGLDMKLLLLYLLIAGAGLLSLG